MNEPSRNLILLDGSVNLRFFSQEFGKRKCKVYPVV